MTFQDDRTLVARPASSEVQFQALALARRRSRVFDEAFGLSCDPGKSTVVGDAAFQPLADQLGYSRSTELALLGVVHPLDPVASKTLSKICFEMVRARMTYIPVVTSNPRLVVHHLRSLCFSQFLWTAGFAQPSAQELALLREYIRNALRASLTFESPPVLVHEVNDWYTSPDFCCDWAALQTAVRMHCRPKEWQEFLPLPEVSEPWHRAMPVAGSLLAKLGWGVSQDGGTITRRDPQGIVRSFRLGFDGLQVLRDWLLLHHRRSALARAGRITRSLHRPEPEFARGLSLPPPPQGSFRRVAAMCGTQNQEENCVWLPLLPAAQVGMFVPGLGSMWLLASVGYCNPPDLT